MENYTKLELTQAKTPMKNRMYTNIKNPKAIPVLIIGIDKKNINFFLLITHSLD